MLRRFSALAAHGDRAERLLASAAIPRGFASSAASSGWWGRETSSSNASSGDDSSNVTSTSGLGDDASVASSSHQVVPSDAFAVHDATSAGGFDPVGLAAAALETAHTTTGLPWWATIACGAVAVRAALFPFTLKQAKASALLNTVIARARDQDGNPPRDLKTVFAAASELRRATNGVSLGWLLGGPLIQLPTFVIAVMSVRRLARDESATSKGLDTGGALWFTDLTEVAVALDSATAPMGVYGAILPCAVTLALFANINNAWGGAAEKSKPALVLKLAMEWLTVPTLLIGLTLPQAVHVYWLPASLTALAQGAAMRTKTARTFLGVGPQFDLKATAPARRRDPAAPSESGVQNARTATLASRERPGPAITFERDLEDREADALRRAADARAEDRTEDAARILARASVGRFEDDSARECSPPAETVAGRRARSASSLKKKEKRKEKNISEKEEPSSFSAAAHPAILFALGQTRAKLRQWRGSALAFDACAAGETDDERRGRALSGAGVASANLNDFAGAAERLEAAALLRPNDVASVLSLAAVLQRAGDLDGAMRALERAAALAPEVRERFIEPLERERQKREKENRASLSRKANGERGGQRR